MINTECSVHKEHKEYKKTTADVSLNMLLVVSQHTSANLRRTFQVSLGKGSAAFKCIVVYLFHALCKEEIKY